MLFISPPFGNYLSFQDSVSIKGSYTLHARSGLFLQIIKTLRYSFENKGWINKIGLRNKGIDYGLQHYRPEKDIISIAIIFPLVFTITGAFQKRQEAIKYFSDFRSNLIAISDYFKVAVTDGMPKKAVDEVNSILKDRNTG